MDVKKMTWKSNRTRIFDLKMQRFIDENKIEEYIFEIIS